MIRDHTLILLDYCILLIITFALRHHNKLSLTKDYKWILKTLLSSITQLNQITIYSKYQELKKITRHIKGLVLSLLIGAVSVH